MVLRTLENHSHFNPEKLARQAGMTISSLLNRSNRWLLKPLLARATANVMTVMLELPRYIVPRPFYRHAKTPQ